MPLGLLACLGACAPAPERIDDCRYAERQAEAEYQFVLPSLRQAAEGESFSFYSRPDPRFRIRLTTWDYSSDYVGRPYKLLGTIQGTDGPYHRWLTEDCRLLYSPVAAGLPAPPPHGPTER